MGKTYNVPDCHCGKDHDSIEHIAIALLTDPQFIMQLGVHGVCAEIQRAAEEVGWRKVNLDGDSLASFLNDPSEELKSLVAESERSTTDEKDTDA